MATRIAVDAMGGDDAPDVVVAGTLQAIQEADDPIEVILFGPESQVQSAIDAHGDLGAAARATHVVDAPDVIGMGEAPAAAVKKKQSSSIHYGLNAHKKGDVDAFVSAGNTGAIMAASIFILGRIAGVERPSIAGYFPNLKGSSIVLDIGSNVDCKPSHLVQFARMGSVYARAVHANEQPSVGLLNIGEEPGKGNDQVKAAYELLQEADDIHFKGNVEGQDLLFYAADIIICDGFVGNILLKFGETMTTVLSEMTSQEMDRQGLSPKERKLVAGVLGEVRKGFDPEGRGGAPLLGVNGNVLIGHGRSTADAVSEMIQFGVHLAGHDVTHTIESAFASREAPS